MCFAYWSRLKLSIVCIAVAKKAMWFHEYLLIAQKPILVDQHREQPPPLQASNLFVAFKIPIFLFDCKRARIPLNKVVVVDLYQMQ